MNGRRIHAPASTPKLPAVNDKSTLFPHHKDDAVSELIGSVLLISIVVVAVSVIGIILWSQPPPQKIPSLSVSMSNSSCNVTLFHGGGDTVENTYIALLVDGIDQTGNFIKQSTGLPWTSWGNGESLTFSPSYPCLLTPQRVDVIYYAGTSRTIIISGYFGDLFSTGGMPRTPGAPIQSDFTGTPTAGFVPFTVQFTDTSTGSPIGWSWNFGDGGTSTLKNPSHTYSTAQSYTVSLTVYNGTGSSTTTKTNFIVGYVPLIAEFTGVPTSGIRPLTVQFTDQSSGSPLLWLWNFGDGTTNSTQNPAHQYTKHGKYTVILQVTNSTGGTNSTTKVKYITVTPNPPWYDTSWGFRKNITIFNNSVSGAQTNFPVLINLSADPDLKTNARSDGFDILFTDSTGTAKIPHEIELYNSGNGALLAWVNVPFVNSSYNNTIYMYYGYPASTNQQNKIGVWDSNYKAIWHLNEGGTGIRYDSTSNTNNANPTNYDGNEATNGKIGGADRLDGINDYLNVGDSGSLDLSGNFTVELWFSPQQVYSMTAGSLQGLLDKGGYKLFLDKSDGKLKAEVSDGTTGWTGPSYNGGQEIINSLAVYNGNLYAGQGSGTGDGDVFVFDGTTWSRIYNGAQENIYALAVYNGKLYAGQGSGTGDGDVLVYDGSTWTTSYNGAQETITSFAVYNGKLYAGQGSGTGDGDVLVFDGTTWSTSNNGAQEIIDSLEVYNGRLYAGQGQGAAGDGDVFVFDGTTWGTSYNGGQEAIRSLAVYNGKLYAGQGDSTGDGDVLVFDGSTWSTSNNGAQEMITSLAVYNGKLYAGQGNGGGDGDVRVFDGTTWGTSYNGAQEIIDSLAVYNGKLYAGQGSGTGDGDVYVLNAGSEVRSTSTSWPATFSFTAATKAGTTLTLYINGVQQPTTTVSATVETNALSLFLGKVYGSRGVGVGEGLYGGIIDEVRVSTTARSANWITTEYNNINSPNTFHYIMEQEEWTG